VNQAIAFFNSYYGTWNFTTRKSQELGNQIPSEDLSEEDLDLVMKFYTPDVQITQVDSGIAGIPAVVFPAVKDFARVNFVQSFMKKQRGSVHKPEYVCVLGQKATVGMRYTVPTVGKFLDPKYPQMGSVAVSVPLIGTYKFQGGIIKSMTLNYDFYYFLSESALNGVPVQ